MLRRTMAVTIGILAVAACGNGADNQDLGDQNEMAPAATPPAAQEQPADQGMAAPATVALNVSQSADMGAYVVDSDGRAVYLFTKDDNGQSACTDACAQAWPPVLAQSATVNGQGLDQAQIGTIVRPDGQTQVTYNGHPLYYFAKDANPGATTGEDVHAFDGEWYLITPSGDKLEPKNGENGEGGTAQPSTGSGA